MANKWWASVSRFSKFSKIQKRKPNSFKKTKSVIAKTGRIAILQGHEIYGLRDIMQRFNVHINQVVYKANDMPKILYIFKGTTHRYIPDFWIPSKNTIVEVKSNYTFEISKDLNLQKAIACFEAGYAFEFWIYNRNGHLLRIYNSDWIKQEVGQLTTFSE